MYVHICTRQFMSINNSPILSFQKACLNRKRAIANNSSGYYFFHCFIIVGYRERAAVRLQMILLYTLSLHMTLTYLHINWACRWYFCTKILNLQMVLLYFCTEPADDTAVLIYQACRRYLSTYVYTETADGTAVLKNWAWRRHSCTFIFSLQWHCCTYTLSLQIMILH
jgi:hypothetical protein